MLYPKAKLFVDSKRQSGLRASYITEAVKHRNFITGKDFALSFPGSRLCILKKCSNVPAFTTL